MSTPVRTIEEGQKLAAQMAGVEFDPSIFIPDPKLRVVSATAALVDPSTIEGSEIVAIALLERQHGFRFNNKDGVEVGVVIAPLSGDRFCVWGVTPEGRAVRF